MITRLMHIHMLYTHAEGMLTNMTSYVHYTDTSTFTCIGHINKNKMTQVFAFTIKYTSNLKTLNLISN